MHKLSDMIGDPGTSASNDGRRWFRAVPCPYPHGPIGRMKEAWAVLTGKAHAVRWPELGELERALKGDRHGSR